jgi:hypothetical protein
MAATTKALTGANEVCGPLDIPQDYSGAGTVQYGNGGLGTIVVEGILEGQDESVAANWIALKLNNPNTKGDVDNLAAVGLGNFECWAYNKVRARKSVAGGGAVTVTLAISPRSA